MIVSVTMVSEKDGRNKRMGFGVFIREFIKEPKKVGACAASSRFLARRMVQQMAGYKNIIEFGPGTGSFTREILKLLPEDGRLTCFETNPKFCKSLEKINDPRLTVINDSALNCRKHVDDYDCIISGLPLTSFDTSLRERILKLSCTSKSYIQFQYTPLLHKRMRHYFKDIEVKFVLRNIPPAFVYVCKNPVKSKA